MRSMDSRAQFSNQNVTRPLHTVLDNGLDHIMGIVSEVVSLVQL